MRSRVEKGDVLGLTPSWSGILAAMDFTVCSTYHAKLQATPDQLVFGRDMILNTPTGKLLGNVRKKDKNNKNKNKNRKPYKYKVHEKLLVCNKKLNKYEETYKCPYPITKV